MVTVITRNLLDSPPTCAIIFPPNCNPFSFSIHAGIIQVPVADGMSFLVSVGRLLAVDVTLLHAGGDVRVARLPACIGPMADERTLNFR